jgi:hypothetical protein
MMGAMPATCNRIQDLLACASFNRSTTRATSTTSEERSRGHAEEAHIDEEYRSTPLKLTARGGNLAMALRLLDHGEFFFYHVDALLS